MASEDDPASLREIPEKFPLLIQHTLDGLSGNVYGSVVHYLKRPLQTP